MSQEIELKLALPRKALPALRRHPLFAGAAKQGNAATLENTYYDTPDLALKARRIGLRTRRHRSVWLQTVKCAAESAGGLSSRPEWEQPYSGTFDFSAVDAPKVRRLLERHASALVPVFTTRFRRETRLHAPSDQVGILMMLDTGEIVAGEHTEPLCELELELVRGTPHDLLQLAAALTADLPLQPEDASKAQRGYRLHLGEPVAPCRAEPSSVAPEQGVLDAFRALAAACMRQWQANLGGAVASDDPEFIHQLRIALRRLRCLVQFFAPALPPSFVEEWQTRLRDTAAHVGEARDLDVLDEEILSPVDAAGTDQAHGLARLAEIAIGAREAARERARQSLAPGVQGRILIDFTAALLALPERSADAPGSLAEFACGQLDYLHRKARQRRKAAANLVPADLHALRIATKRLRYGLEFLAPLLPRKPAQRYLERLTRAQAALGFLNDVEVGYGRLVEWAGDDPGLRAAAAFVRGWHGPRQARLARRGLDKLGRLLRRDPPWAA